MAAAGDDIYTLQAKITQQASTIKELKKAGPGNNLQLIADEVAILTTLRNQLTEMNKDMAPSIQFNRKSFDELILRKMYVIPSFEIHNGPAGLFDYGPPACALKANVTALWRRHFVLEDSMLEMECTNLTPKCVLDTSGHVERFTDFMVRDEITGECFRADKLLEEVIEHLLLSNPGMPFDEQDAHKKIAIQADAFSAEELHEMLVKYNVMSPTNPTNALTKPFPFNLMFKTTIGPDGNSVGFLRPETAQGLFVNFRRLLDFNAGKMPFAAAQIGLGFRNEIAPRNGLLRVREFCMAEIEHFVNPGEKTHPKFASVANRMVTLFSAEMQLSTGRCVQSTIGDAVASGMIDNETLGYFMARTHMWLEIIGVDITRMRFRQHLRTEMAHYATDCWDMEIHISYGWVECVGHADRACYDLLQHQNKTGVQMTASAMLAEPIFEDRTVCVPNKKLLGPKFKLQQKMVIQAIEALEGAALDKFRQEVETNGVGFLSVQSSDGDNAPFEITRELVAFSQESQKITQIKYTPSVIEPSYGIGRILYAVLEHAFTQRNGDENRCVMAFKPKVAPIKVAIYRLLNNASFDPLVTRLKNTLQGKSIATRVDSSTTSVGRRYSRGDELGIPFAVTIDFQTLIDGSVTIRDRDSMSQIRLGGGEVVGLLAQLVNEEVLWSTVITRFMVVNSGEDAADAEDGGDASTKAAATAAATPVGAAVDTTSPAFLQHTPRGSFWIPNPNFVNSKSAAASNK